MRSFKKWCKDRSDWDGLFSIKRFPFIMLILGPVALFTMVSLAIWSHSGCINCCSKDPMFEGVDSDGTYLPS